MLDGLVCYGAGAMYVEQLQLQPLGQGDLEFPLSLPLLQHLDVLNFQQPVTYFIGENGAGKSTLLEGIAAATRLPALVHTAPLSTAGRTLSKHLRLVRKRPGKAGFFFRADDVTGFLSGIAATKREHQDMVAEFSHIEGQWGRDRAMGMARAQVAALDERYGENPFAQSHGEIFLSLLRGRITAPGLYLMDEPESPLSPGNQIALLALIMAKVKAGSQFIIATHSPILMACPDATIYDFDRQPPEPVDWAAVEHVALTRAFLNNPESFLRHFSDE